jgi:hypothetical protein
MGSANQVDLYKEPWGQMSASSLSPDWVFAFPASIHQQRGSNAIVALPLHFILRLIPLMRPTHGKLVY